MIPKNFRNHAGSSDSRARAISPGLAFDLGAELEVAIGQGTSSLRLENFDRPRKRFPVSRTKAVAVYPPRRQRDHRDGLSAPDHLL